MQKSCFEKYFDFEKFAKQNRTKLLSEENPSTETTQRRCAFKLKSLFSACLRWGGPANEVNQGRVNTGLLVEVPDVP